MSDVVTAFDLSELLVKFEEACPQLGIIVVGVTGSGKSTLINNLLGAEVAGIGEGVRSKTQTVTGYRGKISDVPVIIFDTPGLQDSAGGKDQQYVDMIKEAMRINDIHAVVYCFKMNEMRLNNTFVETFKLYKSIGLDWRKTLFALTFADCVVPGVRLRKSDGFDIGKYFVERLQEWKSELSTVLHEKVGIDEDIANTIKICPTVEAINEPLPNSKPWYFPFWCAMIEVLPSYAALRFLAIHRKNVIICEDSSSAVKTALLSSDIKDSSQEVPISTGPSASIPKAPQADVCTQQQDEQMSSTPQKYVNAILQQPFVAPLHTELKPSRTTGKMITIKEVAPKPSERYTPEIVISENEKEDFERMVGKKVEDGVNTWSTLKKVGAVAAGATVLTVAAPIIAAGALVSLPFVAVGAAVAGIFKLFKRKKK